MARDVTNRGGVRGASPPAFTRTTGTSKSPSEAVFIISKVIKGKNFGGNKMATSKTQIIRHTPFQKKMFSLAGRNAFWG